VTGDLLAGAGLLGAGFAAATAILAGPSRLRCTAMLAVVVLAPVLIFGDQWNSSQIQDLRDSPGRLLALGVAVLVAVLALYLLFRRRPEWLALAVIASLPFRIPLHAGGDQANLLVPLYVVIAAGVLLVTLRDWRIGAGSGEGKEAGHGAGAAAGQRGGEGEVVSWAGGAECGDRPEHPPRSAGVVGPIRRQDPPAVTWLARLLALFVVLYTLQVLYSDDFSKGLQNVCFFLAPFSIVFVLLRELRWDRRLLTTALAVMAAEGLLFSLVGFVEYATRDLLWNGAVMRSNQFHVYFRVNSLFWDPNIFGRYLAIVIVLLVAALIWTRRQASALVIVGTTAVLWLGLATSFSQSSYAALLAGLATLAALRWSLRWTLVACAAAAMATVVVALAAGSSLRIDLSTDKKVNKETTGRLNLASGGIDLFGDRPIWGYGSGSFSTAFRQHVAKKTKPPVSESHTEPITVAAEQGIIGLAVYLALLVAAFATLCTGLRGSIPGLQRGPPAPADDSSATGPAGLSPSDAAGRAAVLAAFIALLVHTMAYAAFFEDPITWVLLAVGCALAVSTSHPSRSAAGADPEPDPIRTPV